MPHVKQKVTDYEIRMGYSFNFPAMVTHAGATALRETVTISEVAPKSTDAVTAAINLITDTMRGTG